MSDITLSNDLNDFLCPICYNIMLTDCIVASDQYSYHNSCIIKYFALTKYPKSLYTNMPLTNKYVIPSIHLQKLMIMLIEKTNLFDNYISNLTINDIIENNLFDMINKSNKMQLLFTNNNKYQQILTAKLINLIKNKKYNELQNYIKSININSIDIEYIDDENNTILILASEYHNFDIVEKLLKHKNINNIINNTNKKSENALLWIIYHGISDLALSLLDFKKINVNIQDYNKNTALTLACQKKLFDVIFKLLDFIDININETNQLGYSPLLISAQNNMPNVMIKLLNFNNIEINITDLNKMTPLMYACKYSLSNVAIKLLSFNNINVHISNLNNFTALNYAILNNMFATIMKLITFDIELNNEIIEEICYVIYNNDNT
jgi:ankyrin repeat protein